ncbi:hypothetical protein LC55x_1355 [Lysobacter capsici]|nr:hypothetical protein LC55x_1355 [Lysobacter capsici]
MGTEPGAIARARIRISRNRAPIAAPARRPLGRSGMRMDAPTPLRHHFEP